MKKVSFLLFFVGFFFWGVKEVFAVPPPDFIFNVGAQIAQFFSILVLLFGAVSATVGQFAKTYFVHLKNRKVVLLVLLVAIIGVSSAGAYLYGTYQQNKAYEDWLKESQDNTVSVPASDTSLDQLKIEEPIVSDQRPPHLPPLPPPEPPAPPDIDVAVLEDITFIQTYYQNLGTGNVLAAYEVSRKSVSFDTYKSWYKNVTSIAVDAIQKIDKGRYSLRLSLNEGENQTRYAVLMTLAVGEDGSRRIEDSQVRVLTQADGGAGRPGRVVVVPPPLSEKPLDDATFYEGNKNVPLAISNQEFQKVSNNDIYVLDAREDEEYAIGQFKGSRHIRFADLLAGEWIALPTDQPVYVFCWSGIRGKEVAEFLRSKKIFARFVESGADGWVTFGGAWQGEIKFSAAYPAERYQRLVSTQQVKEKSASGATIVDSRTKAKYDAWHIPGSINIPIIYTPSSKIEELLNQVPAGSPVITVCDEFISCFDAKITGLKLEKKGHEFLGRYNKPWEFRNGQ